jgi:hypothetical protein
LRCTFQFLIGFIHKQNILEDAAWKALQFTYGHLFYNCTFCFQNRQNFEQSNCDHAKKIMFSIYNEFIFIISLFHHLICFIERKTKYTTRCSVKSSTIYTVKLIVIVFRKRKFYVANVRDAQNLIPQNFIDFENKMYSYKISSRM